MVPPHTIVGMLELYELTLTKVYHACKTHTHQPDDTLCNSVAKLPKASLTCWRVALGLRRISTLRIIMLPSKYCSERCLESFSSLT